MPEGTQFCASCGKSQPGAAARAAPAPQPTVSEKYGIAALLSFFLPGLGQVVKGHIGKALLIWLGLVAFFLLSFIVIGIPLLIVLWFWQIYDAYNAPQAV